MYNREFHNKKVSDTGIGNMREERVVQKERVNMQERVSKQITMLRKKENRDMLEY
jgi:hypothetical protein